MNTRTYSLAVLAVLGGWALANAARPAVADTAKPDALKAKDATTTKDVPTAEHSYLGVVMEPLYPGMASHLPEVLIQGQGVLVTYVAPDSPAAKAGIQQDDILVQLDDQKLITAEQLAKLVMSKKHGADVDIELIRGGKLQTVHATLGKRAQGDAVVHDTRSWWRDFSLPWLHHHRQMQRQSQVSPKASDQESFDSLTLKQTDKGKFHAEISYLDNEGKLQHHAFDGTRAEIKEAVQSEKNLPENERNQLLNAVVNPQHAMALPEFGWDRAGDINFHWQSLPQDY